MEQNYTKRELDDHFQVVNDKLDSINCNVKATNGRVKKLEMWRFGLAMSGGVITFAVLPLLMYIYFDKVDQIQDKLEQTVKQMNNNMNDSIEKSVESSIKRRDAEMQLNIDKTIKQVLSQYNLVIN